MGKSIKKIISSLLSFVLILDQTVVMANAEQQVSTENRTIDHIKNLIGGSNPSDIPVAGVTPSAHNEKTLLISGMDLSQYAGKNIFVGYGAYDIDQKFCKYIEKPNVNPSEYDHFYVTANFQDHSYGIEPTKMDFSNCNARALQLGGHVFNPDTSAELASIMSKLMSSPISGKIPNVAWTGIYKKDCSDPTIYNAQGGKQDYINFSKEETGTFCDPSKKNVVIQKDIGGQMRYAAPYENAYCIIEFDSPIMQRPIKVCAPWWRVIKEYTKSDQDPFWNKYTADSDGGINMDMLKAINQADIPLQMRICTKYNQDGLGYLQEDRPTRMVQCTTYYSRKVAPECLKDPMQKQCFVNECKGYVENVCQLRKEKKVGKGYVKGEVVINGFKKEMKVLLDIKTRMYECPPSTISNKYCIEASNVVVFPKECPGSKCIERKDCIANARLQGGDMNAAINQCIDQYPCEKIYPSKDYPILAGDVNANGEVVKLHGKCKDGTVLDFPVNIQDKISKKCLKYEEKIIKQKALEKCSLDRAFTKHVVDMSITDQDPYEKRPECLRTDKAKESQHLISVSFDIKTNGFFNHKITKINLDRTTEVLADIISGGYLEDNAKYNRGYHDVYGFELSKNAGTFNTESHPIADSSAQEAKCIGMFSENSVRGFINKMLYVMFDNEDPNYEPPSSEDSASADMANTIDQRVSAITHKDLSGQVHSSNLVVSVDVTNVQDGDIQSFCKNYPYNHNFDNYKQSYMYWTSHSSNVPHAGCNIVLKQESSGIDSIISSVAPYNQYSSGTSADGIIINFKSIPSNMTCKDVAYCMGAGVNQNGAPSGSVCSVIFGKDDDVAEDDPREKEEEKTSASLPNTVQWDMCRPHGGAYHASTKIDGIRSIIVFEDYTDGGFGYFSNFTTFVPIANQIKVKVDGESPVVVPLKNVPAITDYFHYHGFYHHESWRKKSPDLLMFVLAGGAAGAVAYYTQALLPALGAGLIVLVIFLLFLKPKKMDRQVSEFYIYKDIPIKRYPNNQYRIYETRLTNEEDKQSVSSSVWSRYRTNKGSNSVDSHPDFVRRIYFHQLSDTGIDKPGNVRKRLKTFLVNKYNILACMGFDRSEITRLTHSDEKSINYGYPKCKWYNPWCEKRRDHNREIITNIAGPTEKVKTTKTARIISSGVSNMQRMAKTVSNIYLGADNGVVILVPYIGTYKVEAYNKYGDLISSRIIQEDSFAEDTNGNTLLYAAVNFGYSMDIADGVGKKNCRMDQMVEWGGGVSGVYYESGKTAEGKDCAKSNDAYVFDQSATKLFVQSVGMDDGFEINLTKPLPFPNRVWLATLNKKEKRHYICYKDFANCESNNFKKVDK